MKTIEAKTKVIYRKFPDGDVIALFPGVQAGGVYIQSYQAIGQHSGASLELINDLERCTAEEIAPLAAELETIGYDLEEDKTI